MFRPISQNTSPTNSLASSKPLTAPPSPSISATQRESTSTSALKPRQLGEHREQRTNTLDYKAVLFSVGQNNCTMLALDTIDETINQKNSEGRTLLLEAAQSGNIDTLLQLIKNGADLNIGDNKKMTLLHHAATNTQLRYDFDKIFDKIREKNLGNENAVAEAVNAQDDENRTSLLLAAEKNDDNVITKLLENGAKIDLLPRDKALLRVLAVRRSPDDITQIQELIKEKPELATMPLGPEKETLLHIMANNNHHDMVILLLDTPNVDVNARDIRGCTPVHYAKDRKMFQALIDQNANLGALNFSNQLPLHSFVANERTEIVGPALGIMLEQGIKISTEDSTGRTPVKMALDALDGHQPKLEDITKIIKAFADRDLAPTFPLQYKKRQFQIEEMPKLDIKAAIKSGLIKDVTSFSKNTDRTVTGPLHAAVRAQDLELVKVLLEVLLTMNPEDAKIDAQTSVFKASALGDAILNKDIPILECMLDAYVKLHADINKKDTGGYTAMHRAADSLDQEMVEQVLDAYIKIGKTDDEINSLTDENDTPQTLAQTPEIAALFNKEALDARREKLNQDAKKA